MKIFKESKQLESLNEMFVNVDSGINTNISNSVYYPKIKHMLFGEINLFCKEQVELKDDLNVLRMLVGETMTEDQIRSYLDNMMEKYNDEVNNVGIIYHIEQTRVDFGVPVIVIIKRDTIYVKKFVFRFRKEMTRGIGDLSTAGILKRDIPKILSNKNKEGDNQ